MSCRQASAVTRISSLVRGLLAALLGTEDKTLKKEMADRSSTNEQTLGMITHNSERWCRLQARSKVRVQWFRGQV